MANKNLNAAKSAKKDEFYTQLVDIENELKHYREHFRGKTVLCNCDDPRVSNFFHYFSYNFETQEFTFPLMGMYTALLRFFVSLKIFLVASRIAIFCNS